MLGRWAIFRIPCTLIVNMCDMSLVCHVLHYITLHWKYSPLQPNSISGAHASYWRMCKCGVTYLLTNSNVNFSGAIWHCATELNSIQLHDSFMMVTLESISLHYITLQINTTVRSFFGHCHLATSVIPSTKVYASRAKPFLTGVLSALASQRSQLSIGGES